MKRLERLLAGLALVVVAGAVQAAPAPLPKAPAAPTSGQLQHRLRARGIAVEAVQRGHEPGEWVVIMKVSGVRNGRGVERLILKTVRASGPDERAVLQALLTGGQDAADLLEEHERYLLDAW